MANRSARVVSVVAAAALGLGAVAATATTASAAAKLPAGCKSLTLAFFGAQTGDAANLGINESNGAQLAVNQYNAKKPKVAVKLVKFDSQGGTGTRPRTEGDQGPLHRRHRRPRLLRRVQGRRPDLRARADPVHDRFGHEPDARRQRLEVLAPRCR